MDILYEKKRDKENDSWGLENKSFYTLFEVLHLADRYDLKKVVDIITKKISEMEITRENVMEAAAVAEHYKLFPEVGRHSCTALSLHLHVNMWCRLPKDCSKGVRPL